MLSDDGGVCTTSSSRIRRARLRFGTLVGRAGWACRRAGRVAATGRLRRAFFGAFAFLAPVRARRALAVGRLAERRAVVRFRALLADARVDPAFRFAIADVLSQP